MSEIWLSKLKPDEVGQPYIDVRAHKAYWDSVRGAADSAIAQLNGLILSGDFKAADKVTKQYVEQIQRSGEFFLKEYKISLTGGKDTP